jgi:hypothetical protein
MHVGGIFCDLAKDFDCENHENLLAKLCFYGIRGVSEDWFRSYLTNIRQNGEVRSPKKPNIFYIETRSSSRINFRASLAHITVYRNDLLLGINSISETI